MLAGDPEKGDCYCGVSGNSIFVLRVKDKETILAHDCCEYKKTDYPSGAPENPTIER